MSNTMKTTTQLSEHFTLKEATDSLKASSLGIANTPTSAQIETLKISAIGMERVRALLGNKPIKVNSWYRSAILNAAIKGSKNSQHMLGEAIDFICAAFGTPREICKLLVQYADLIRYDQLILEPTWVHISFAIVSKPAPRKQALTLTPAGKKLVGIV